MPNPPPRWLRKTLVQGRESKPGGTHGPRWWCCRPLQDAMHAESRTHRRTQEGGVLHKCDCLCTGRPVRGTTLGRACDGKALLLQWKCLFRNGGSQTRRAKPLPALRRRQKRSDRQQAGAPRGRECRPFSSASLPPTPFSRDGDQRRYSCYPAGVLVDMVNAGGLRLTVRSSMGQLHHVPRPLMM